MYNNTIKKILNRTSRAWSTGIPRRYLRQNGLIIHASPHLCHHLYLQGLLTALESSSEVDELGFLNTAISLQCAIIPCTENKKKTHLLHASGRESTYESIWIGPSVKLFLFPWAQLYLKETIVCPLFPQGERAQQMLMSESYSEWGHRNCNKPAMPYEAWEFRSETTLPHNSLSRASVICNPILHVRILLFWWMHLGVMWYFLHNVGMKWLIIINRKCSKLSGLSSRILSDDELSHDHD